MNVRRRLLAPVALSVLMMGGPTLLEAQDPPRPVTRVFDIQHINPSDLRETLSLFSADLVYNNNLRTLTVRALPEIMPALEDVIRRLDVPSQRRTVELTAYILSAGDDGGSTGSVPEHLQDVVNQLRTTFAYQSFQLLDTILVRGFDGGRPNVQGIMSPPDYTGALPDQPTFYNFSGEFRVEDSDDGLSFLRIDEMRSGFRIPVRTTATETTTQFQYIDVGINTDIEIPPDTQVVVGKATVGRSALILVMTAELSD